LQTKKADVDENNKTGSGSRVGGNDVAAKKDRKHNALAVLRVFLNVRNGSWILTVFFIGLCNGLIWGFLFWHLDNLGNYHHWRAFYPPENTETIRNVSENKKFSRETVRRIKMWLSINSHKNCRITTFNVHRSFTLPFQAKTSFP